MEHIPNTPKPTPDELRKVGDYLRYGYAPTVAQVNEGREARGAVNAANLCDMLAEDAEATDAA